MMKMISAVNLRVLVTIGLAWLCFVNIVHAQSTETLRIVTYNIDADTGGAQGAMGGVDAGPGLSAVLQAIGAEKIGGVSQPIDVLALEELNGTGANANNATNATLQYFTSELNSIYGAGTYAYDTVTDPTDGSSETGNGPSGLIYNTHTIRDLGATAIGTVGGSGAARAPMLYQLAPVANPSASFYMFVEHAKSGTTSSDADRREAEATEVRAAAATLPSGAHVIYAGDFNLNASTDASYQTMIASGVNQAYDPANPTENWLDTSNYHAIMTESATDLEYRDDVQFVNAAVLNGSGSGPTLVSGAYEAFGNNGSTPFNGAVNASGNTALSDLPNQQAVLNALTTVTDHLPVVADYAILTPEPNSLALMAFAALPLAWIVRKHRHRARPMAI